MWNTRHPSFFRDDDGAAMLEFVIIAPLLCYLIVGILFFHHELDYAQDSVSVIDELVFTKTLPDVARGVRGGDSDQNGFGVGMNIRAGVQAAGALGASSSMSTGAIIAGLLFYDLAGGSLSTPYNRINLVSNNYDTSDEPSTSRPGLSEPENPWKRMLGGFGKYFGNRIGGGEVTLPQDLQAGWVERVPVIVDPWQRQFSTKLDVGDYSVFNVLLEALNVMTLWRAEPIPRIDNRDSDIGASSTVDGCGSCDGLRLQSVSSSSEIATIVK